MKLQFLILILSYSSCPSIISCFALRSSVLFGGKAKVLNSFDNNLKKRTLLNSTAVAKVESDEIAWSVSGYRKPLHWVQKVSHLEDTLKFYQSNFGFKIYRHEEFSSGCEATCNGPYGGAWSKTMIGLGTDESNSFCLELVFNYGVNRYERGNDLRSIALRRSAFIGDSSQIGRDPYGRQFIETPDGHWLNLVEDAGSDSLSQSIDSQNDGFKHISLHVTNLTSSMSYYEKVLGASVKMNDDLSSALATWDTSKSGAASTILRNSLPLSKTGIELVELPVGEVMDACASQGRFAIETEDRALEGMAMIAKRAEEMGSGTIIHGPVSLAPHGEEVLILRDEDGHEFCFVDARGFKTCVDVSQRKVCTALAIRLSFCRISSI
jgi:catechol 2,3-dioxygenase-like lactoylglutathione lyase family enzyme